MKAKLFLCWLMTAAGLTALAAVNKTGSHEGNAASLSFTTAGTSNARALVDEYYPPEDGEPAYNTGNGVFYEKCTLTRGKAYTICYTDVSNPDISFYQMEKWSETVFVSASFSAHTVGDMTFYCLEADDWDLEEDPSTWTFYFSAEDGAIGDTFTSHGVLGGWQTVMPRGIDENPERVTLQARGQLQKTAPYNSGEYWLALPMEAGKQYVFSTENGTSNNAVRLEFELPEVEGATLLPDCRPWPASGEYNTALVAVPPETGTYYLHVESENNEIRVGYEIVEVGTVGFAADDVAVEASNSVARLTVTRSSSVGAVRVKWGTVRSSAAPQVEYVNESGILSWADGDMSPKTIDVRLLPSAVAGAADGKSFYVQLEPLRVDEVEEGEFVVTVARDLCKVTLHEDGGSDEPDIPEGVAEDGDLSLGIGTYRGVLSGPSGFASIVIDSDSQTNFTATVKGGDGRTYELPGAAGFVELDLPADLKVADLKKSPACGGTARVMLYEDGASYEGSVYRDESRLEPVSIKRLAPYVGDYSVCLAPLADPSGAVGLLHFALTADGSVSGDIAGEAGLVPADGEDGFRVAIPFVKPLGSGIAGGEIVLVAEDGRLVAHENLSKVWWCLGGNRTELFAGGGFAETVVNLESLFRMRTLTFEGDAFALSGATLTFDGNVPSLAGSELAYDAETGRLSGFVSGIRIDGLLLYGVRRASPFGSVAFALDVGAATRSGYAEIVARPSSVDPSEDWGRPSSVTFDVNNAQATGTVPAVIEGGAGSEFRVPGEDLAASGFEFLYWRDASGRRYYRGERGIMPPVATVLVAEWTLSVEGLSEALGYDGEFVVTGDKGWIPGADADGLFVHSDEIGDSQSATMTTCLNGSGRLLFDYKASSESGYDKLEVRLDNEVVLAASGETGWTSFSRDVETDGVHELSFTYSKDSSRKAGEDGAFVRKLRYGATARIVLDPTKGTLDETEIVGIVGDPIGALPVPACDTWTFGHWESADGAEVTPEKRLPKDGLSLKAVWLEKHWEISFDGNGGEGTVTNESWVAGQTIVLPEPKGLSRVGYEFVAWNDGEANYKSGDEYLVPYHDVVFSAVWTLSVKDIPDALEKSDNMADVTYVMAGDEPWLAQTNEFHSTFENIENDSAVQTARTKDGASSTLSAQFTTLGRARGSFMWKASSEQGYDKLSWSLDGVEQTAISGETEWTRVDFEVAAGAHEVRWTYSKDGSGSKFRDCGWVDEFCVEDLVTVTFVVLRKDADFAETNVTYVAGSMYGEGLPVPVSPHDTFDVWIVDPEDPDSEWLAPESYAPDAGETLTVYDSWLGYKEYELSFHADDADGGTAPDPIYSTAGESFELPPCGDLVKDGYVFAGWFDGTRLTPTNALYTVPSNDVAFAAQWTLSTEGIAEALGCPERTFLASGDKPWLVDRATFSPALAVRSGAVADNGSCTLETKIAGTGVLRFRYRTSSEGNYDKLVVTLDGEEIVVASGESSDWTLFERTIGTDGVRTLRWTYSKDRSGSAGGDCAWIADFEFGATALVRYDPTLGTLPESERERLLIVGKAIGAMPEPTSEKYSFAAWTNVLTAAEVTPTNVVPAEGLSLAAAWGPKKWTVTFARNGGEGDDMGSLEGFGGTTNVLPVCTWTKPGYAFAGWMDSAGHVRAAGAEYVFGESDETMTAQWTLSTEGIAEALGCPGHHFDVNGDAPYVPLSDHVKSGSVLDYQKTVLSTVVKGSGVVSFRWAVSSEARYDTFSFAVDGETIATISGEQPWVEFPHVIVGERVHELRWTYEKDKSDSRGDDCGRLASFRWTPDKVPEYAFEIAMDANVTAVTYSVGDKTKTSETNLVVMVPEGESIVVNATCDTDNWYYISSGTNVFYEAGSTLVTAKRRTADELPKDVKPDDVGLSVKEGAPFAEADAEEVAKAVAWALVNGKRVSEMNGLSFSEGAHGTPLDDVSAAYLLNCAPTAEALAEALAGFRFSSFDPANPPTAEVFADKGYNGKVKILGNETLGSGCEWREDCPEAHFYKAVLIK